MKFAGAYDLRLAAALKTPTRANVDSATYPTMTLWDLFLWMS